MQRPAAMPRGVIALGFVSLFMDVSSEMIHALLPIFLVSTLGASVLAVGLIAGAAEAAVSITKVFSGAISDWIGRRKPLLLLGYGLAALTKPVFPLAHSATTVFAAHLTDRIGKGIRGAPRDALVADLTPSELRGAAYGLRQSMDTVGAFIGPLLALALMWLYADDIRAVFSWAVLPAMLAVLTIVLFVREPQRHGASTTRGFPIRRESLRELHAGFWWVVAAGCAVTVARLSEAFLLLRGSDAGLAAGEVPWVLVGMNLAYALGAWPFGAWADRRDARQVLGLGLALLFAGHLALAVGGMAGLWIGVVLWGLHMAATQGVLAALVSQNCAEPLRGTAFGLFNLATGAAALAAGALAGALWNEWGARAAYSAGAVCAIVAAALLPAVRSKRSS